MELGGHGGVRTGMEEHGGAWRCAAAPGMACLMFAKGMAISVFQFS